MSDYRLRLDAMSLASKWGFNDGDMPDDMPSGVDYNLWREHTLPMIVRHHLLPKLEGVEVYQLGTCHNPIRTDDLRGHDDVFVYVSLDDILAAQGANQ